MTGIFDKLRGKTSESNSQQPEGNSNAEPTYSIQPHPATTNNPADLQGPQPGGGLQNARDPAFNVHLTPGPVINSGAAEQPVSDKNELSARAAELNK